MVLGGSASSEKGSRLVAEFLRLLLCRITVNAGKSVAYRRPRWQRFDVDVKLRPDRGLSVQGAKTQVDHFA